MALAAFDEMNGIPGAAMGDSAVREAYDSLKSWLDTTPPEHFNTRRSQAEMLFRRIGITFAVYGANESTERLIPFDIIPRVITKPEWSFLERGLKQRVTAINAFLSDIYGAQECIKAGIIPADLVYRNPHYRMEMRAFKVPHDLYVHIAGIDIVRTGENDFFVLEDNARTPSGVSYMLENREVMLRLFPELFSRHRVAPVENYPDFPARDPTQPGSADGDPEIPPSYCSPPVATIRLSTNTPSWPTSLASIWWRHLTSSPRTTSSTCAPRKARAESMSSTAAWTTISSTPWCFRPDSVLGVPGLMNAYRGRDGNPCQRGRHRYRGRQGGLQLHAGES